MCIGVNGGETTQGSPRLLAILMPYTPWSKALRMRGRVYCLKVAYVRWLATLVCFVTVDY